MENVPIQFAIQSQIIKDENSQVMVSQVSELV